MTKQDDGLFLLEVLIDKVVFIKSPCFSDKDFRTCVNIECSNIEPLEICDDDPGVSTSKSMGPFVKNFNSGKSCLFSLKESEISAAMSKFPVKVSIYKSLPCGCLPTKIVMGETTIDMTKEFVEARKNFLTDPNNVSYQALKDSFRIFGPDGTETGEIVMFLRISCFGKLIITRFQGGGPPALSAGGGNAIVDRSCNPQREFQTSQEPCACGAARGSAGLGAAGGNEGTMGGGIGGGGGGVCPPARDLYNIMPCQDPDDPCYCTGPKPPPKDPMACRNTDQYCLHIPKGELLKKPYTQEIIKEQKINLMTTMQTDRLFMSEIVLANIKECNERSNIQKQFARLPDYSMQPSESYTVYENISTFAFDSIESNKQSIPLFNTLDYANNSQSDYLNSEHDSFDLENDLFFGTKETAVYMTLYDDLSYNHSLRSRSTAGTQATASINKCLQIQNESDISTRRPNTISSNSCNYSSCTMTTNPYYGNKKIDRMRYSDVYFFGRKRDPPNPEQMEMGKKVKLQRGGQTNSIPIQTNKVTGASTGTSTKTVSIKEDKSCNESTCPAIAQSVKGDMVATVSHIKLGPREPCPVHGKEPCQGPKCIVASSGEEKAPVKVTTVSNPRRGVFELVIRKMTGAPLAKNELMLEWTPPPNQPSCITPCILPCSPTVPSCHPSKCKMIVCRPTPCKPNGCRKPCGPPCRSVPCSFCCNKVCSKPCRPCKPRRPCTPPRCRPCSPCKPCKQCKPCRPCPPPRKIFKRPCRPPPCKPCGRCRPCSPCESPPPCKPSSPCRSCRRCKPCPPMRCKPCRRCLPCPSSPCRSCRPCPPSPCRPFPPPPCSPCSLCPPCPPLCTPSSFCDTTYRGSSYTSSPCLPPCAMVRKKSRKCKSHPRIKAHRKRISPCSNRSKCCPVVRCRSLPGVCVRCCGILPRLPQKCCPIISCKPPRCRSSCSTYCA
ncbi:unnamed protein product [Chilo suppressalis]|uniref:Uncharacterized protein n=1 Tax=Chilo suppressalis TaxID=168631 RepID=A0ABN8B3H3_CHISP|nr:unnamed protein product [Chilo suppressalis]